MIINHEKRFVFIHNPKVGGTSIRKLFLDQAPVDDRYHARGTIDGVVFDTSHIPVSHWTDELVEAYVNGYYFFGIIKDPVDRFKSALSEIMFQTPDFVMKFGYKTVAEFVTAILSKDLARFDSRFVHFSPQWSYFCLPDPATGCLGRLPGIQVFSLYELADDRSKWEELWAKTIGTQPVPHFDNLRPSFYKPLGLDPGTTGFVKEFYSADYCLFPGVNKGDGSILRKEVTADSLSTERLDWIARNGSSIKVPAINLREKNAHERYHLWGDEFSWAQCQLFQHLNTRKV
jgi:hypothetical protein